MPFTRPLATVTAVTLLALALLALLPDCASACQCAMPPASQSQQEIAKQALSDSAAVFAGEVVEIDRPSRPLKSSIDPVTVTFRVSESWKGPVRGMLKVRTPVSGVSCGYSFRSGESYLVYASEASIVEGEGLEVLLCSETKPLSEASADLEALGNGETLGSGGALVDTSGGFLGFWMIGMMGLAIAVVSLVVLLRLVRTS